MGPTPTDTTDAVMGTARLQRGYHAFVQCQPKCPSHVRRNKAEGRTGALCAADSFKASCCWVYLNTRSGATYAETGLSHAQKHSPSWSRNSESY